jgi:hypothetical protein
LTLFLVQPPAAPAAPHPSSPGWIDLKEAARRSGWDEGYLRRRCCDDKRCPDGTWLSRGLARQQRPPEGGKARWLVHETVELSELLEWRRHQSVARPITRTSSRWSRIPPTT